MKRALGAVALLVAIVLLLVGEHALSQQQPPVVNAQMLAVWPSTTTDINGNPETLSHYDLAVTAQGQRPEDVTVNVAQVEPVVGPGAPEVTASVAPLLSGEPAGTYDLWVRAVDQAENTSTWVGPASVVWDTVAPRPPASISIRFTVEVTQ